MTPSQIAMHAVLSILPALEAEAKERQRAGGRATRGPRGGRRAARRAGDKSGAAATLAAQTVGVGSRTVEKAKLVATRRPDLIDRVLSGELSVARAAKELEVAALVDGEIVERVYFIQSADGPIKIGWSTSPSMRLDSFQIGCPHELRLLCSIPMPGAGAEAEAMLHKKFAASRFRGEWFRPTPEVLAMVEMFAAAEARGLSLSDLVRISEQIDLPPEKP